MRISASIALFTGLMFLTACVAIETITARQVQYDNNTFVVMNYGTIGELDDDLEGEPDRTTATHIYQVLPDGQYHHLGAWNAGVPA